MNMSREEAYKKIRNVKLEGNLYFQQIDIERILDALGFAPEPVDELAEAVKAYNEAADDLEKYKLGSIDWTRRHNLSGLQSDCPKGLRDYANEMRDAYDKRIKEQAVKIRELEARLSLTEPDRRAE